MSVGEHWEQEAERWAVWARKDGHDSYWSESGHLSSTFSLSQACTSWTWVVVKGASHVI